MADSDKNILITPNTSAAADPKIVFSSGATSGDPITLSTVDDGTTSTLRFEGSAGQLFSISNDMSGTIFSVGDVSGVPSIEADATGDVRIAEFGGNVQIGNSSGNVTMPSTLSVLGGSGGDLSVFGSIASTTSSSAFSVNVTTGKMHLVDDSEPAIYLDTTDLNHQWQLFNSYGNIGLVHYNTDPSIAGFKNTQYLFYYTPTNNVDDAYLYFQVNGNEGMRITNTVSTVPEVTMPGDLTVSGTNVIQYPAGGDVAKFRYMVEFGGGSTAEQAVQGITNLSEIITRIGTANLDDWAFKITPSNFFNTNGQRGRGVYVNGVSAANTFGERVLINSASSSFTIGLENNGAILYSTANAFVNFLINVRGNTQLGTTVDKIMEVGESITFVHMQTQGSTGYIPSTFQLDFSTKTVQWQGGAAPSPEINCIQVFSFTIIKTSGNIFTILGNSTSY